LVTLIGLAAAGAATAQTFNWNLNGTADWNVATDWTPSGPPNGGAVIASDTLAGSIIDFSSADTYTVSSFTDSGGFNMTGGTLTAGTVSVDGAFTLGGGEIDNAAITAGLGLNVTGSATLNGATINNNVDLSAGSLTISGGTTFASGLTTTIAASTALYWNQTSTLSNQNLNFTGWPGYVDVQGSNTLTLDTTTALSGNGIYLEGNAIVNNGSINASSGANNYITTTSFTNSGTLEASGGATFNVQPGSSWIAGGSIQSNGAGSILNLAGTLSLTSSAATPFSTSAGGVINLTGTLNNTGLTFDPTVNVTGTKNFVVTSGTISGGNLNHSSSLLITDGTLTGVTLDGGLNLTNIASGQVYIQGGTVFGAGGTTTLGSSSELHWNQTSTLSNQNLVFNAWPGYVNVEGSNVLTLDTTTNLSGNGIYLVGNSVVNNGSINASAGATNYVQTTSFSNSGTLEASGGATFNVEPTNAWVAGGSIQSNGAGSILNLAGTLSLTGSSATPFSTSAGGVINLTGTLNNTGLTFDPTVNVTGTKNFVVDGGTISGGNLDHSTALLISTGTLNGVTLDGGLNLTNIADGTAYIEGGTVLGAGGTTTIGSSSTLHWDQTSTLSNQTLNFTGWPGYVYVDSSYTLTLAPTTTVSGSGFYFYGNAIVNNTDINASSGANNYISPTTLTNGGTIQASGGAALEVSPTNFTNTGTVEASGGATLTLQPTEAWTASGTNDFQANGTGSILNLSGPMSLSSSSATPFSTSAGGVINLTGTLENTGLTFDPTVNVTGTQNFVLYGGTISGGNLDHSSSLLIRTGTLNGVTLDGGLNLTNIAGGTAYIEAGTVFGAGGTTTLGSSSELYWEQTSTLSNQNVVFTGWPGYIYVEGSNTLTLDTNTTLSGNGLYLYGNAIVNNGNINASSGANNDITPTSFTNNGTVEATGGATLDVAPGSAWTAGGSIQSNGAGSVLNMGGTFSLASSSAAPFSTSAGGAINLTGTLNNTGLTFDPTVNVTGTQNFVVDGGTITGGNLDHSSALLIKSGTLNGVSLDGGLNLTNIADGTAYIEGGTVFGAGGTTTIGPSSELYWEQTSTLSNQNVVFTGWPGYIYVEGSNTLTLDTNTTLSGNGLYLYGNAIVNNGAINASSGANNSIDPTSFTNGGTLEASGGATLNVQAGNTWTAGGSIQSNGAGSILNLGGTLVLTGSSATPFSTSAGGVINLTGTLNNTGLTFDPTVNVTGTQNFVVDGGTITGGNLDHSSSLLIRTGTLNGVTLDGGLNLTNIAGGTAYIEGGTVFGAGGTTTLGASSELYLEQTGTLSNQTVNFTGWPGYVYVSGSNTLTLDTNTTLSGNGLYLYGNAIVNNGNINASSGANNYIAPTTFTNGGTVQATGGASLNIQPTTFTNTGTLKASGSGSAISVSQTVFANAGTVDAEAGSTITFNNNISQSAGSMIANGTISVSQSSPTITINGGNVSGSGKIEASLENVSGTVSPGSPIGTLTLTGTYTQDASGKLVEDLGGSAPGSGYSVLTTSGAVTLGGTLDVQLVNGFTPTNGETFDIIDYGSRTGTFATVTFPTNGSWAISYLDSSDVVRLTVDGLTTTPGPDSLAVLAVGMAGLGTLIRRRTRR
jgi:hypothetical protein